MSNSEELKKIKKAYGENFMHLCRELFPTILEEEGLLYRVLFKSFSENCQTLYEDIKENSLEDEFKNYIYSKIDVEKEKPEIIENKTPKELLEEAGYDLFECITEEEIQSFKRYYAEGEELCTFNGNRLDRCVVFFAVKKDVDNIKRENFTRPKREDEYGTSVMSIQFERRGKCTVSIKNRYNHKVNNPDATYGNDLERITPGLTQSFADLLLQRGLELDNSNIEKLDLPYYTVANDGKYYKYNMEIDANYYCPGNIIIEDGKAIKLEKPEEEILIDYFILDMKNKEIRGYEPNLEEDGFIKSLGEIEKVEICKNKEKGNGIRTIKIQQKGETLPIIIEIDKNNKIIGYRNETLEVVEDKFLLYDYDLKWLELPKVKKVGSGCLPYNQGLTHFEMPNAMYFGDYLLENNFNLTKFNAPKAKVFGNNCLYQAKSLIELELLSAKTIGNKFLYKAVNMTRIKLPEVETIGDYMLYTNEKLRYLGAPNATDIGECLLFANMSLAQIEMRKLKNIGKFYLFKNHYARDVIESILEKNRSVDARRYI